METLITAKGKVETIQPLQSAKLEGDEHTDLVALAKLENRTVQMLKLYKINNINLHK